MNDPNVYFRLAHKQRTGGSSDNLRIYASRNCGESWSLRYNKTGSSLATVSGTQGTAYVPSSSSDWELVEVDLSGYQNDEHVLIKFQGKSDEGNNVYIDDIQISGPLSVEEEQHDFEFSIASNPTVGSTSVSLSVANTGYYSIDMMDVTGRVLSKIHEGQLGFGNHSFPIEEAKTYSSGVYLIRVFNGISERVNKLVVN
jgi:hypothetical protein